jgi:hypothetical protein
VKFTEHPALGPTVPRTVLMSANEVALIGTLGGLIGLGGAEFRLPLGPYGPARITHEHPGYWLGCDIPFLICSVT